MAEPVLRIARASDHLEEVAAMYKKGLGLTELGGFKDHDGFDGVMLGHPDHAWHLEFTAKRGHEAGRAPNEDALLVFYVPDQDPWLARCAAMEAAGFKPVNAFNPYWDKRGKTFEDPDGYRVVIQNTSSPV